MVDKPQSQSPSPCTCAHDLVNHNLDGQCTVPKCQCQAFTADKRPPVGCLLRIRVEAGQADCVLQLPPSVPDADKFMDNLLLKIQQADVSDDTAFTQPEQDVLQALKKLMYDAARMGCSVKVIQAWDRDQFAKVKEAASAKPSQA